jgi:hypothetical protein
MDLVSWYYAIAFLAVFAPAAFIWGGVYFLAVEFRRRAPKALTRKSLRMGISVAGFFVCFVLALFFRAIADPTSHEPIGAAPTLQAILLYVWLDPRREGKVDNSFHWVMTCVLAASAISVSLLAGTNSGLSQPGEAHLPERELGDSSASVSSDAEGLLASPCRREWINGLEMINCD